MSIPFTTEELVKELKSIKVGKAPGPDDIHPEFLLHAGDAVTKRLCQYMSTCLERCPKMWRMATVIALPKRNKPKNDPKSYRAISLLCILFKLLERMIHGCINPIIDPQLPHEQAGFRTGRLTVDQITLLTQDFEDCFKAKGTAGAVLVDLTAAYDTASWVDPETPPDAARYIYGALHYGADLKPQLVLKTSDGQQTRLRRLKNGVPRDLSSPHCCSTSTSMTILIPSPSRATPMT